MQIKHVRKQFKMVKQKVPGICGNRMEKTKREKKKKTLQLEEINQNVLAKEEILKRYRNWVKQYRLKRTFPKKRKKILSTTGRA